MVSAVDHWLCNELKTKDANTHFGKSSASPVLYSAIWWKVANILLSFLMKNEKYQ